MNFGQPPSRFWKLYLGESFLHVKEFVFVFHDSAFNRKSTMVHISVALKHLLFVHQIIKFGVHKGTVAKKYHAICLKEQVATEYATVIDSYLQESVIFQIFNTGSINTDIYNMDQYSIFYCIF
jgi:hypothetical protein